MSNVVIPYRFRLKRDVAANWTANNPTLLEGEFGLETDTGKLKLGNGVTAWNSLGYHIQTTVQAGSYTIAGAWTFSHNISIAGMTVGLGPGENAGNLAIGASAMAARTTGGNNLAIGTSALAAATSGSQNVAIGSLALASVLVHGGNTAIGRQALWKTAAHNNTGIGYLAASDNTSGQSNVAIGTSSLQLNVSGTENTAIGYRAGRTGTTANANVSGDSNTYIGANAGPGTPTQLSRATVIGASALVTTSNTVVLGATTDNTVLGATGDDGSGAKLQVTGVIKTTTHFKVGANQVVGARNTGWTAMTGTGSKGALAAAAAGTASTAYVQAELQAALDRIAALEARLKSLDDALVAHGLIGA